jgi:Fe-S oxidoreductase
LHDPCYLARANQEVEAQRAVLDAAFNHRAEIEPHGRQVFCCGGGGGQMWLEVRGQTRVENIRAAQAEAAAPQSVATACPFCRVMVEAGRTSLPAGQGNWRVRDVAELVAERMME